MSDEIEIIALLKPKPGKADRVQELLSNTAAYVQANEPGTTRYHLQREVRGDAPLLIMLETYKDKAALGIHGGSAAFKTLGRTMKEEDLLAEPMKVLFTKGTAGFESRL